MLFQPRFALNRKILIYKNIFFLYLLGTISVFGLPRIKLPIHLSWTCVSYFAYSCVHILRGKNSKSSGGFQRSEIYWICSLHHTRNMDGAGINSFICGGLTYQSQSNCVFCQFSMRFCRETELMGIYTSSNKCRTCTSYCQASIHYFLSLVC